MPGLENLSELRQLAGVPREELEILEARGARVRFAPDTVVIRQGDPANSAYLVVSGQMAASVESGGGSRPVGDVWPGDVVGESALFGTSTVRSATLTARSEVWALELTPELMEELRGTQLLVALQRHLMEVMSRRLRGTDVAIRKAWQEQRQAEGAARKAAASGEKPARPGRPPPEPEPTGLLSRLSRLFGGT